MIAVYAIESEVAVGTAVAAESFGVSVSVASGESITTSMVSPVGSILVIFRPWQPVSITAYTDMTIVATIAAAIVFEVFKKEFLRFISLL